MNQLNGNVCVEMFQTWKGKESDRNKCDMPLKQMEHKQEQINVNAQTDKSVLNVPNAKAQQLLQYHNSTKGEHIVFAICLADLDVGIAIVSIESSSQNDSYFE